MTPHYISLDHSYQKKKTFSEHNLFPFLLTVSAPKHTIIIRLHLIFKNSILITEISKLTRKKIKEIKGNDIFFSYYIYMKYEIKLNYL